MFSGAWVKRAAAPWLVFAATLAFQLPFFDRWFSSMDEGHVLEFADLLNQGGLLHRDATSYPLDGAFYLLAGAFRAFGTSILVSRWLVGVEFAVFVALSYALLRRLVPPSYALLGVLLLWLYRAWAFPHWQIFNYSTTALLLQTASLLLLVRHLESRRRSAAPRGGPALRTRRLLQAGLRRGRAARDDGHARRRGAGRTGHRSCAASPTSCCRVRRSARRRACCILAQGQLGLVLQQTVVNHFVGMSSYAYPSLPSLFPLFTQDPALRGLGSVHQWVPALVVASGPDWKTLLESRLYAETALYDTVVKAFVYGPVALLALLAWRQWRLRASLRDPATRARALTERALLHFAAAYLLLAYVYKPQDYLHLAVLYAPLVWLAVPALHGALGARPRLAALAALLALAPACAVTGWLLASLRGLHSEPLPGPRAGVYVRPGQARMLGELVDYVRETTRPGERVGAMPYLPIALFLADRLAPHAASYIVWPFPEYADRDRRIADALEAQQTDLVLYNFTQFPNLPPMHEYAPELYAYLVDHYEMERVFSDELLGQRIGALRRRAPPQGEPLLRDPRAGELEAESYDGSRKRIAGRRRDDFLVRQVWPFRPVLALRPLPYGARAVLSLPLRVPARRAARERRRRASRRLVPDPDLGDHLRAARARRRRHRGALLAHARSAPRARRPRLVRLRGRSLALRRPRDHARALDGRLGSRGLFAGDGRLRGAAPRRCRTRADARKQPLEQLDAAGQRVARSRPRRGAAPSASRRAASASRSRAASASACSVPSTTSAVPCARHASVRWCWSPAGIGVVTHGRPSASTQPSRPPPAQTTTSAPHTRSTIADGSTSASARHALAQARATRDAADPRRPRARTPASRDALGRRREDIARGRPPSCQPPPPGAKSA